MQTQKTTAHFTAAELLNPVNPISVCLIGAGGTGSQVLTGLARISHSLQALGHAVFQVSLWDDDIITQANMGRQLFAHCEAGLSKAAALIARTNRFFGTSWKAVEKPFTSQTSHRASIYISCVDTAAARFGIADALHRIKTDAGYTDIPRYWMDFGNSKDKAQVILSTIGDIKQPDSEIFTPVGNLPFVTDEFAELLLESETEDLPSCSLAEALEKQDLFINSAAAQLGCSLLWQMFRNGMLFKRGSFINLDAFSMQGMMI